MSEDDFREKWMKLGYDRIKRQGQFAEFPTERIHSTRPAYGRNGVGRHGMLCFSPEYSVITTRDKKTARFEIATTSGDNPFEIAGVERGTKAGHGTTQSATVVRNLPSEKRIADILPARFLHAP